MCLSYSHCARVCVCVCVCDCVCKHEPQCGQSKSKFLQTAAACEPCHVCVCICGNVCDCEVHSCGGAEGGGGGAEEEEEQEEEGVLRSEPGTTPPSAVWSPSSASPFALLRQYRLFFLCLSPLSLHLMFPHVPTYSFCSALSPPPPFPRSGGSSCTSALLFPSTSGHSCCSLILALAFLLSLWFPHFSPLSLPRFVQQPNG